MNGRLPSFSVGSDRVLRNGLARTVISRIEMEDWQVREYRRTAVWMTGVRYAVTGRTGGGSGTIRYRLEPWPDDESDPPGAEVIYDDDYVAVRDGLHNRRQRNSVIRCLLFPLYPLLGLLWFPAKERLQLSLGVEPGKVTGQSLLLQYIVILALLTMTMISIYAPLGIPTLWLVGPVLVLLPDAIMRWGLVQVDFPAGFGEWLVRQERC